MSSSSEAACFPDAGGEGAHQVAVATGNSHKLEEIRATLGFEGWSFLATSELGEWEQPEETGATFEDNARIKARAAFEVFGGCALADDSGLEVDALGGEPGVYSARYAGAEATDAENNTKLLAALEDTPEGERTARFRCVMVFVDRDGRETVAQGTCEGHIAFEPRGEQGFGYDPLFLPDATPGRMMAELAMDEKNAISHRGAALRALRESLGG